VLREATYTFFSIEKEKKRERKDVISLKHYAQRITSHSF
jgi:hypothetical protein